MTLLLGLRALCPEGGGIWKKEAEKFQGRKKKKSHAESASEGIFRNVERKLYFPRKKWNTVGGPVPFEGNGRLATKINRYNNLFYGNKVLNIFRLIIFLKIATFFKKKTKKNFKHDHFLGDGVIYAKNKYNLFYRRLDAKYFHVNNFFGKNSIFWGIERIWPFFWEKECLTQNINVNFFITN